MMEINDFVSHYKNHPVLFIGTGFSLRYLQNSFSWDDLLMKVAVDLTGNPEVYYDLKAESIEGDEYRYDILATKLEDAFNIALASDRYGKFADINDVFYENMKAGKKLSRFKIYLTSILKELKIKDSMKDEIESLIKTRKNIGSVITTNYDQLIEHFFDFIPLIGNNILLSNPYGSVYKIHGCVSDPNNIIITQSDYDNFNSKYELIRAQLLSIFIHNPIIFLGYSISDKNIKYLLQTIFSYVDLNTDLAKRIKDNFLLVEYEKDNQSTFISEHDINIEGLSIIRINKIKTDNYKAVYDAISNLVLPVSAMDIRKVQKVWNTIKSGGEIKVKITENLDELRNEEMVIAVGSEKTVRYEYQTKSEMLQNYFKIIAEANSQLIALLNKQTINNKEHFPIYAFSSICPELENTDVAKERQLDKIVSQINRSRADCRSDFTSIADVIANTAQWKVASTIACCVLDDNISLEELKTYLISISNNVNTEYRQLLCLYDYLVY
ncbi:SIR2 family protein [Cronobacter malonaticus]|uniref:SIR2 family protein n=2 Tax=Cronobacter sakazakii TaxID=28141 RepID=UPI001F169D2E|nr:SIR2 family protein [Cronobacter sakazakii]MDK1271725.1 SIR2 family protein [Cronobacter sakazakii]